MLINWNKFISDWLPVRLRTDSVLAMFSTLINGAVYVYDQLTIYDADVRYKLAHTSQVCSIEGVLNDTFDPIERRIYLQDAGGSIVTILNRDTDEPPYIVLDKDAYTALVIHKDSSYDGGTYDFVVVTPYTLTEADKYRLKAMVNFYKLAGKRYDINSAA